MNKKMLYLEDDQVLASVTKRSLIKRQFDVDHIYDMDEFYRISNLNEYSYALLDLKVGDEVSIPCIETLVSANPEMKILILTGYASIPTAVKAIKLGATNYLAKPATVDQVLAAFDEQNTTPDEPALPDKISLRRIEWEHIQKILDENDGNISATARQLNMHRRTLQRKLAKKPVRD